MNTTIIAPGWRNNGDYVLRRLLGASSSLDPGGENTDCILLGMPQENDKRQLQRLPCRKVILARAEYSDRHNAKDIAESLMELVAGADGIVLLAAEILTSGLAVHLSMALNAPCVLDVIDMECNHDALVVRRGAYNHNLQAEMQMRLPGVISVDLSGYGPVDASGSPEIQTRDVALPHAGNDVTLVMDEPSGRLDEAQRLVVAGRGVGGAGGLEVLAQLADALGARLGVSRPVAVDGWASHESIVGMSGAIAHPDIALCFAVSGAAPLLTGIRASRFIVTVNKDATAPIFRHCDVGIVGDYRQVAEALIECIPPQQKKGG